MSGQDKTSLKRELMQSHLRREMIQSSRGRGRKQSFGVIENEQLQKKVSPFESNCDINRLKSLMSAVNRASLASAKGRPTVQNLLDISDLACKIMFTIPVTKIDDVERCLRCFSTYRDVKIKIENNETVTLDEVVVKGFIKKLCQRFTYKTRLRDLLKNRPIPPEKKEKWLHYHYEMQGRLLKETDSISIRFLNLLFERRPVLIYQVLDALLKLSNDEEIFYDFINTVLKNFSVYRIKLLKPILSLTQNEEHMEYFQNVKTLAETPGKLPLITRHLLAEHWKEPAEAAKLPKPKLIHTIKRR